MKLLRLLLLALPLLAAGSLQAQNPVNGSIVTEGEGRPLAGVLVSNLHSGASVTADSSGHFSIPADRDQLLQFTRDGYAVTRLRIPSPQMPPVLVQLRTATQPRTDDPALEGLNAYQIDSLRMADTYQRALALQRLTGYRAIQSPFSYFSKRNRQIWHFQEEFEYFERQKYVDFVFNDSLIVKIAKVPADSLQRYKQAFTPSYDQLRAMRNYTELYYYVKETAEIWRRRERSRATIRSGR